jgi:hypothetical protein
MAARCGFVHVGAIANERLGAYYLERASLYTNSAAVADYEWATFYFDRAWNLYSEWGAEGKLRQFEQVYDYTSATSPSTEFQREDSGRQSSNDNSRFKSSRDFVNKHNAPLIPMS